MKFKFEWICKECRLEFESSTAKCPGCSSTRLIRRYKFEKNWQCRSCKKRYTSHVPVCPRCGKANSKRKGKVLF